MAQIHINITLDGIESNMSADSLADMIENIVKQSSGFDSVSTSVYDSDSSSQSNPITMHSLLRRVK
jgi:hypothetical protein